MSLDPDRALLVVAIVAAVAIVSIVLFIRFAGRRRRCVRCGARIPRGAIECSACNQPPAHSAAVQPGQDPPALPAEFPELVAVQGPLAQQHFPIPLQGLAIGRQFDNDVVLGDELMVSRHHAALSWEQGQWVLYDRDSSNGTWVNDQRIFRHVLTPGDRIQIWQSQFVFAFPGRPLPSPAPVVPATPVVHVEGQRFAGYVLEDMIGRGGMSEVFKARDPGGQLVAIKILQQSDPYLVNKFVQEGNKIGPLLRNHPNIIFVHEFGRSDDGRLYIVMEYVDAPSLRRLTRQALAEPQVVAIMGQVCSALAFAHRHNVVHRDIKPENILVTAEGKVKVLDFGIAKLTSAATVTRDKIVGTPEYISPEQARGEPVCPASDVYALGIVLYELLAGSVPFRRPPGDDPYRAAMEVIRQHLKERPEPLRKRNPEIQVSKRLEQVTMRALKKETRERFSSAREMGQAMGYKEPNESPVQPERPESVGLVVMRGPRQGLRIPLSGDAVILGRLDLDPANTSISRQHITIFPRGQSYWLQDLSKNGTWVDSQRVMGEIPIKTGSKIAIGDSVLQLDRL